MMEILLQKWDLYFASLAPSVFFLLLSDYYWSVYLRFSWGSISYKDSWNIGLLLTDFVYFIHHCWLLSFILWIKIDF